MRTRHHLTLEAIEIINELSAQPLGLKEWGFSEEHCRVTARQLGIFTGFAGLRHCNPDPISSRAALVQPEQIDEAPFLNPTMFLLLSRESPVLTLAQCLVRARFGTWSTDYRTFFHSGNQAKASDAMGNSNRVNSRFWGCARNFLRNRN